MSALGVEPAEASFDGRPPAQQGCGFSLEEPRGYRTGRTPAACGGKPAPGSMGSVQAANAERIAAYGSRGSVTGNQLRSERSKPCPGIFPVELDFHLKLQRCHLS